MIAPSIWSQGGRPRVTIDRLEDGRDAIDRLIGGAEAALASSPLLQDGGALLAAPIGLDRVLAPAVDRDRGGGGGGAIGRPADRTPMDRAAAPMDRAAIAGAPAAAARLRSATAPAPMRSSMPPAARPRTSPRPVGPGAASGGAAGRRGLAAVGASLGERDPAGPRIDREAAGVDAPRTVMDGGSDPRGRDRDPRTVTDRDPREDVTGAAWVTPVRGVADREAAASTIPGSDDRDPREARPAVDRGIAPGLRADRGDDRDPMAARPAIARGVAPGLRDDRSGDRADPIPARDDRGGDRANAISARDDRGGDRADERRPSPAGRVRAPGPAYRSADPDRVPWFARDRAGDRAAARAWLAGHAARAGTADAIDRRIAVGPSPAILVPTGEPPRAQGPAGGALDTATGGEPAARGEHAASLGAAAQLAGLVDRAGRSAAVVDRAGRSTVVRFTRGAPDDARTGRGADDDMPGPAAEPGVSTTAPLVSPTTAAPLASAPLSPLRRFAVLSEAPAPPSPGEPPSSRPAPPPLDDAELAERLDRILRREARRLGLDLDP